MISDDKVTFGSRNLTLQDNSGGNWKRCITFVKSKLNEVKLSLYNGLIFYGECCVKHSLSYDWDKIPPYLGFDIKEIETGKYLSYKRKKEIFEELGLELVPLIKECKVKDLGEELEEDIIPISAYPPRGEPEMLAEGIVIKNYERQQFAKFVRQSFREVNKETFGENKKYVEDDTDKIMVMYCTNPRIDKIIFKLVDDGVKLDMPMMHVLPNTVWLDIVEEHAYDIMNSRMTIDFRKAKKILGKRCLRVLSQVIENNALAEMKK